MQLKVYMMKRLPTKQARHQTREFSIHSNMTGANRWISVYRK